VRGALGGRKCWALSVRRNLAKSGSSDLFEGGGALETLISFPTSRGTKRGICRGRRGRLGGVLGRRLADSRSVFPGEAYLQEGGQRVGGGTVRLKSAVLGKRDLNARRLPVLRGGDSPEEKLVERD